MQNGVNWFDWLSQIIVPIVIAGITAYVNIKYVNKNTNRQISNQNIQSTRPRLKLEEVIKANSKDMNKKGSYELISKNVDKAQDILLFFKITLKNIGYGIANDIKFFNLHNGCICPQKLFMNFHENQTMFQTEEIANGDKCSFDFRIIFNQQEKNVVGIEDDNVLLLCNYKDLYNTNYNLIIGIRYKGKNYKDIDVVDYFYYQEGTYYYDEIIKKYKKNYENILTTLKINENDKILKQLTTKILKFIKNK